MRRFAFFITLLAFCFAVEAKGEEYVLKIMEMRQVDGVTWSEGGLSGAEDFAASVGKGGVTASVSSAPVNEAVFTTRVFDYPDSMIVSERGRLTTINKEGADSVCVASIENRRLRLSPASRPEAVMRREFDGPQFALFEAWAEEPERDSLSVTVSLAWVPRGMVMVVIDGDSVRNVSLIDRYFAVSMTDSLGMASVSGELTRDFYVRGGEFPFLREITESVIVGSDTVVGVPLTLLAVDEAVALAEESLDPDTSLASSPVGNFSISTQAGDGELLSVRVSTSQPNDRGMEGTVRVFDVLGRLLAVPQAITLAGAVGEARLRLTAPLPGVYLVNFAADGVSETAKIVR